MNFDLLSLEDNNLNKNFNLDIEEYLKESKILSSIYNLNNLSNKLVSIDTESSDNIKESMNVLASSIGIDVEEEGFIAKVFRKTLDIITKIINKIIEYIKKFVRFIKKLLGVKLDINDLSPWDKKTMYVVSTLEKYDMYIDEFAERLLLQNLETLRNLYNEISKVNYEFKDNNVPEPKLKVDVKNHLDIFSDICKISTDAKIYSVSYEDSANDRIYIKLIYGGYYEFKKTGLDSYCVLPLNEYSENEYIEKSTERISSRKDKLEKVFENVINETTDISEKLEEELKELKDKIEKADKFDLSSSNEMSNESRKNAFDFNLMFGDFGVIIQTVNKNITDTIESLSLFKKID